MTGVFKGNGRFQIRRRLGAGGFGIVYDALDTKRNTSVALKTLREFDPAALFRFKQEFRMLADVDHVNLVSLYELFVDGDEWFFTMELVDGMTLVDYVWDRTPTAVPDQVSVSDDTPTIGPDSLESRAEAAPIADVSSSAADARPLRLDRLRSVMQQVAEALYTIHQMGILHRDIKPSNVLVTPDGRAVLLDFGLVTELVDVDGAGQLIIGTPAYMSPEQAAGRTVGEPTDWYALGVMLYEALTGGLPVRTDAGPWTHESLSPRSITRDLPDDLVHLCEDLLRRDPAERPTGPEVVRRLAPGASATARGLATPAVAMVAGALVGRDRQLAALMDAYDAATHGGAVVASVAGRSGMGKSALVRRFLLNVRQRNRRTVVLKHRCYEQESVPYKAIDGIVDQLAQYLGRLDFEEARDLLPSDVMTLVRLFPVLRAVDPIAARRDAIETIDSQELRRRAFRAFRDLVEAIGRRQPIVLFIDDLQWGDLDSVALLVELLRQPDPPPLLLVAAYREEERDTSAVLRSLLPVLTAQAAGRQYLDIQVGELSEPETRELVSAMLGDGSEAAAHTDAIVDQAGGNPFFVEELVRYALEHGRVVGLDQIMDARMSQLSAEARQLLELVSVTAQPLDLDVAVRAAGTDVNATPVLHQLRARRLVRTRGGSDATAVEAYHDRIREAVVASLGSERLRKHHAQLAEAWEASGRADPEVLATHFHGAGNGERAADYADQAASAADAALAFDRAARLYRWVLDLRAADASDHRPTRVKLATALANTGRGQQAAEAFLAAATGAGEDAKIDLERQAAEQLLRVGSVDQGLKVMNSVLDRVGLKSAKTSLTALPPLLFRRAYLGVRGYDFRERDASQIRPEVLRRIDTSWSAALGLHLVDTVRAANYQHQTLLLSLRAGDPWRVVRALAMQIGNVTIAGGRRKFAVVEELRRRSMAIADRLDSVHARALTLLNTGVAWRLLGRHPESLQLLEEAIALLRERCVGVTWEVQGGRVFVMENLFWLGDWSEMSRRLPEYVQLSEDLGDLFGATYMSGRIRPWVQLFADNPALARADAQEAVSKWSTQAFHMQHLFGLEAQLFADLYTGEGRKGLERQQQYRGPVRRSLLLQVQSLRVQHTFLRASLALSAGAMGDSALLTSAERDARRLEREDIPWAEALAGLIRAGTAASSGDRAHALARLAESERQLDVCRLDAFATAARWRRGQLMGGDAGRELVATAERWMTAQTVVDPEKVMNMLTPGRWQAAT